MTPQWRQLTAAQVLEGLLQYNPPLSWTIPPTPDGPPELNGTPGLCCVSDEDHRALITAWAELLESPVEQEQYETFTFLCVRTSLFGVDIEIATSVGLTVPALDGAL